MGFIDAVVSAGVDAAVRGGPRRQYKWNKKAAEDANRMNRENQQWLLEQNKALQAEQRQYDSPQSQMARYLEAGLNPHLIYGSGSSAGQAFPVDAGGLAPARIDAPQAGYPEIGSMFLAAQQSLAQTGLLNQRTSESEASTALKSIQTDIAKTNPMLDPSVASWVSESMLEAARVKAVESRSWMTKVRGQDVVKITAKVNAELEAAMQRLGLNTADLQIKNRILESKEFENMVKEIQAKWLKDAQVSPEHIRQGLMLLLSKMLGK